MIFRLHLQYTSVFFSIFLVDKNVITLTTTCSAVADYNWFEYKKRLLLRCIHHFKSDLINNMDQMRISGTEPSSVILSQTNLFKKLKSDAP